MLISKSGRRILPWMKNCIPRQTKVLSLGIENRENISETHIQAMEDITNTSWADDPMLSLVYTPSQLCYSKENSGYIEPDVLMTWTSSCFGVCTATRDKICPMEVSPTDLCVCVWLTVLSGEATRESWWCSSKSQTQQRTWCILPVFPQASDSFPLNGTINMNLI